MIKCLAQPVLRQGTVFRRFSKCFSAVYNYCYISPVGVCGNYRPYPQISLRSSTGVAPDTPTPGQAPLADFTKAALQALTRFASHRSRPLPRCQNARLGAVDHRCRLSRSFLVYRKAERPAGASRFGAVSPLAVRTSLSHDATTLARLAEGGVSSNAEHAVSPRALHFERDSRTVPGCPNAPSPKTVKYYRWLVEDPAARSPPIGRISRCSPSVAIKLSGVPSAINGGTISPVSLLRQSGILRIKRAVPVRRRAYEHNSQPLIVSNPVKAPIERDRYLVRPTPKQDCISPPNWAFR